MSIAEFWTRLGELSGPGVTAALFVWALATERLVLGRQYRAERARADKYDDANRDLTDQLIKMSASQQATTSILEALRESAEAIAGKGGSA